MGTSIQNDRYQGLNEHNNPNNKKNLYEIIIDDIYARIHSGDFSYDEPICTEKQLSLQYGVSRITAKRAITDLEHQGVLYRKRGVGSFVAKDAEAKKEQPVSIPTQASNTFAFLIPFDTAKGGLIDTVTEVSTVLNEAGYFMGIYITSEKASKEKYAIRQLLQQHIAGVVYYPKSNKIYLDMLNNFVVNGKPVIIIDKTNDCSYIHNVVSDNFEGGKLLTEHLISLGHKKIAFLSNASIEETSSVRDRFGGYLHALRMNGVPVNMDHMANNLGYLTEKVAISGNSIPELNAVVNRLYNSGVTAIEAENDQVAYSIFCSCKELNIRVPQDMSICGFDNTVWSQKTEMGITTVSQDFPEIGRQISRILLSSLKDSAYATQKCVVPVKLIVRGSTQPPSKETQN